MNLKSVLLLHSTLFHLKMHVINLSCVKSSYAGEVFSGRWWCSDAEVGQEREGDNVVCFSVMDFCIN